MTKRKMSPNSLENLEKRGRKPDWDQPKKRRYLSVTDDGFDGALGMARSLGCTSVSDLLEELGRYDRHSEAFLEFQRISRDSPSVYTVG